MLDELVAEDTAQATAELTPDQQPTTLLESPAGDQPKDVELPKADAKAKSTAPQPTVAELVALLETTNKALAKTNADLALTKKALSSRDKASAVELARVKALALGQDADAAEQAISDEHRKDDKTLEQANIKAMQDEAKAEMGDALRAAGFSVEADWNDRGNKDLAAIRRQWVLAYNQGATDVLSELADEVKVMKKAAPVPVGKTREQREAELSLADPGAGRGSVGNMTWARAQKITKVTDLNDETYEKLVAR